MNTQKHTNDQAAPRRAAPSWASSGDGGPSRAQLTAPTAPPDPEERIIVTVRIPTPGTSCLYQNVHVYLLCSPHRRAQKLLRETLAPGELSPRGVCGRPHHGRQEQFLSRNYKLSREAEDASQAFSAFLTVPCIQASEVTQAGPGHDTTFTATDLFAWALVSLPHLQTQFLA